MIIHRFFWLLCIIVLLPTASADEMSEASEPVPQAITKDGKVVSPENEVSNGDEQEATKVAEKKPEPKAVMPPEGMVPKAFLKMGTGDYFAEHAFLLDKKTRTLSIWKSTKEGPQLVEAHPADMGRRAGDKQVLGDKKTPEGIYFFLTTYSGSNLDFNEYGAQAFTMDYPNLFDRREKKTGSGIWLHAVPDTKTLYRGSRGCIVVRNEIITTLGRFIDFKKTPIIVQTEAEYITPKAYLAKQKEMTDWLNAWRESWEAMDIDKYMSFYADDFYSLRMNKKNWRRFKKGLNEKYEFVRVQVAKPNIMIHEDEVVIRFLQGYNSDKNSDFGEKTLHIKKQSDGSYKIIAERWSALSNKLLALLSEEKKAEL